VQNPFRAHPAAPPRPSHGREHEPDADFWRMKKTFLTSCSQRHRVARHRIRADLATRGGVLRPPPVFVVPPGPPGKTRRLFAPLSAISTRFFSARSFAFFFGSMELCPGFLRRGPANHSCAIGNRKMPKAVGATRTYSSNQHPDLPSIPSPKANQVGDRPASVHVPPPRRNPISLHGLSASSAPAVRFNMLPERSGLDGSGRARQERDRSAPTHQGPSPSPL